MGLLYYILPALFIISEIKMFLEIIDTRYVYYLIAKMYFVNEPILIITQLKLYCVISLAAQ